VGPKKKLATARETGCRGGFRGGGSLGSMDPPPLGLHRHIEQYVYYPAVVHLSAFTVRSIIAFTNAAFLRINPPPPLRTQLASFPDCFATVDRHGYEAAQKLLSATCWQEEAVR